MALANGAMGLGLEIFDIRYWIAYVVVTIVFEAWMIGRWMGKGWTASLLLSILANSITAFMCTFTLAPVFHSQSINPDPFASTLQLFVCFGLCSAIAESVVWLTNRGTVTFNGRVFLRTIRTHLIGVPVGLAILLIPPHPYRGPQKLAEFWRWHYLAKYLPRRLGAFDEGRRIPQAQTLPELWGKLQRVADESPDAWIAVYRPSYGRFSRADETGQPIAEWNRLLSGKTWSEIREGPRTWLIRGWDSEGNAMGVLSSDNNMWGYVSDPTKLGYASSNRDQSPR